MDALFGRGHTHFPIFDHTVFECVDWPGLHFKTIYGCGGVLIFEVANFDVDMSVHNQKKTNVLLSTFLDFYSRFGGAVVFDVCLFLFIFLLYSRESLFGKTS